MTTLNDILARRVSRRSVLQWGGVAAVASGLGVGSWPLAVQAEQSFAFDFESVPHANTPRHALAKGYQLQILARWGDPLFAADAEFDPAALTAKTQARRFGFNNDFTAYLPLEGSSQHGLLHVNHEYTISALMFPDTELSAEQMRIEMAAHGFSVLEIKRDAKGDWQHNLRSRYTRRVDATTPMRLSGPAAGHSRMRTLADPLGIKVLGTIGNCAGGKTPWGTVLVSEENFDGYFYGRTQTPEQASHDRYTVGKETFYGWYRTDPRFAVAREPNEPNRFGWVVEYDPYDPKSQPVKRTALGRFKHETATCALAKDGRVVVYSGDDDYFEYLYRFVSAEKAGKDALDTGTLQVAKFHADGKLEWIPLVFGQHGLTPQNGFYSQADVLIEARRAGDVVGATKMDRPEGIAVHPQTQAVYISLTKNPYRAQTDAANPRKANKAGHIVLLQPDGGDHGGNDYRWDIFLLAGNPEADAPRYGKRPGKNDWLGCPDNLAMDAKGRLWICTDGMPEAHGYADGLYAAATQSDNRAAPRQFFRAPIGAEVTGPSFTPDGETLFLSVQHPGEDSTFKAPSTRWPDFNDALPPRPAVVAITRKGGGGIGG